MTWETHPVTPDRFEDFADVINRSRRANHCWCPSHRLRAAELEEFGGVGRAEGNIAVNGGDGLIVVIGPA